MQSGALLLSDLSAVQVWQQILPHLWRNPDQERMGDDRRSLCGQVLLAPSTQTACGEL